MIDNNRPAPYEHLLGQTILDAVNAQVAVLDRHGLIVLVNEPWRRFARENSADGKHMAPRTGIGVNYLDICTRAVGASSEGAAEIGDGIRAVLAGRSRCYSREYPCHAPDRRRWFVLTVIPLALGHGGAVVSHTDITDSRQLAEALRAANERLSRAQGAACAGMWDWDVASGEMRWSAELFQLFGLDPELAEASFPTWRAVLHPEDLLAAESVIQAAFERHQPLDSEYRIRLPTGEVRWISARGDTVYADDGQPARMSGICLDITARKRAEIELRAERDTSKRYLDTVEAIIVALDHLGRVTLLNRKGQALLGYGAGELDGQNWFERCLPQPEGKDLVYPAFQRLMAGEIEGIEYFENPVLTRAGELRLVAWHNTLLRDETGGITGVLSAGEDITERRQAEETLRASEARYRSLVEQAADGIFVADPQGRYVDANSAAGAMLGLTRQELLTLGIADVLAPEEIPRIGPEVARLEGGKVVTSEWRFRRKDGTCWYGEVRGRQLEDGRLQAIVRDITERRQAEDALFEASRRKDEFLAMLAHELRNPLAPIRNAAHVLGRLHLDEPRVQWARQVIEQQVEQLVRMVDDLLDVSRIVRGRITLRQESFELSRLIANAVEAARPALEDKGHRFELNIPEGELMLRGDWARLTQVLVNLLDNAAKYTPHGGHIVLDAAVRGGTLEIEVRDNGMGMSADLLPEIFDLFHQGERTLDRSQGGLGIGLTLVKRLVEMHAGEVEASSPGPGLGATIRLRLPLTTTPASDRPEARGDGDSRAAGRRVLIVDDEPMVAESTAIFLELEGHEVRTADSGETALRILAEFHPQVVLLDIGLPGQDGYQVARRIRQLPGGWNLHLVAMSGYGQAEVQRRCREAGFDQHLVKPVEPRVLSAACRVETADQDAFGPGQWR